MNTFDSKFFAYSFDEMNCAYLRDEESLLLHIKDSLGKVVWLPKVKESVLWDVLIAALEVRVFTDVGQDVERRITVHQPGHYEGRRWVMDTPTNIVIWCDEDNQLCWSLSGRKFKDGNID